jgi:hypothetical protein
MEQPRIMASRVGNSHHTAIRRTGDIRINARMAMVKARAPVPF